MPPRRLFHTPLPLRTLLRNSRSGSSWLHLLCTTFSALCVLDQSPRYLLMRLCRRLYTASRLMMSPHKDLLRSSPSGASSPTILQTAKLCCRHIAMLEAPHRLNLRSLLRFAAPAAPAMLATVTRSMPVNVPHMVYLLKRHWCDLVCVHPSQSRPPQSHVSTTQVGSHPVRSATTHKRSASTALAGTHNPVGEDPRAGTGPFPKPRALVLPMVKFGQSKPDGLSYIDTVDSDLMHHQYRLSVLQ